MSQKLNGLSIYLKQNTRLIFTLRVGTIGLFLLLFSMLDSCKDSCKDVVCQNGGTCVSGKCNCPDGFSGANCETNVSANFLGTYNVSETCPNATTYTVNIGVDTLNVYGVKIANFFNSFSNLVNATVNQTIITIPLQDPDNDGRSVSGSGSFHPPNEIIWNYLVSDGINTISCSNSVWKK